MQIIALEDVAPTLWRNGGGLTRPLAAGSCSPRQGAAPHLDDADWRISLAEIAADGPFSSFPGFDRHAVLLGSGVVELSGPAGGATAHPLAPIGFPGEAQLEARLHGGPVRFLNLMVRRALLCGELRIAERPCEVGDALAWAVLPVAGGWEVQGAGVVAPGYVAAGAAAEPLRAAPANASARAVLALVRRHGALCA